MDAALLQVGLPVRCRKCRVQGFVRPQTDYGGWWRLKLLRGRSIWYCPEDRLDGQHGEEAIKSWYPDKKAEPVVDTSTTEEELYKLLEA